MKLYAFVLQINPKTIKLNFCFDFIKYCIYLRLLHFIFFPFQNARRLAYSGEPCDISMVYDIYGRFNPELVKMVVGGMWVENLQTKSQLSHKFNSLRMYSLPLWNNTRGPILDRLLHYI